MQSRRSFLRHSTLATAAAVTVPTIFSTKAFAQSSTGIPTNLQEATNAAHAISTANTWIGGTNSIDWSNLSSAHQAIHNYFQSTNFIADTDVKNAAARTNSLLQMTMDYTPIIQRIQIYQSGFQSADWLALTNRIPIDPGSVSTALQSIQQRGISYYVGESTGKFAWMSQLLNGNISMGDSDGLQPWRKRRRILQPAIYHPLDGPPRFETTGWGGASTHPEQAFKNEGGGGSTFDARCKADAAFNLSVGTALLVIAAMTLGPEAVLVGAAWEGIATWGGFAAGGWSLVHAMICGF